MKLKTNVLAGVYLDYAVAKALNPNRETRLEKDGCYVSDFPNAWFPERFRYDVKNLFKQEKMRAVWENGVCRANLPDSDFEGVGKTAELAIARAFVGAKLGEMVDIVDNRSKPHEAGKSVIMDFANYLLKKEVK